MLTLEGNITPEGLKTPQQLEDEYNTWIDLAENQILARHLKPILLHDQGLITQIQGKNTKMIAIHLKITHNYYN